MSRKSDSSTVAILVFLLLIAGGAAWLLNRVSPGTPTPSDTPPTTVESPATTPPDVIKETPPLLNGKVSLRPELLSEMAPLPDWTELGNYQSTLTRTQFEQELRDIYTVSEDWKPWFDLKNDSVLIRSDASTSQPETFRFRFAGEGLTSPAPRPWRSAKELPPASANKPLEGLRIAIDPGHIGGSWAKMEERWFQIGQDKPVTEGDMTLQVAKLLKPQLEALGATIIMVRDTTDPHTKQLPEAIRTEAKQRLANVQESAAKSWAEQMFYRTAEIRARAELVNQTIKPDIVLCLHFNAEAWGNPSTPTLVEKNHFHLLMNGAYTADELKLADQRLALSKRIAMGTHAEETGLALAMRDAFLAHNPLPPYHYEASSSRAKMVAGSPYIWARNLLANRLYDCPVVFLEPYVMNSKVDYARIQAGDYEGKRMIDGIERPSIFREYADAVTDGLAAYYRSQRTAKTD